jgi:hypothetical protein
MSFWHSGTLLHAAGQPNKRKKKTMKMMIKGAVALAAIVSVASAASAQIKLFDGVVRSYGEVTESGGQVTGVGTWEGFTFFPQGVGHNYLTEIDFSTSTFNVRAMTPFTQGTATLPIYLSGSFLTTTNNVSGNNFTFNGNIEFTSGDWFADLASQLGNPSAQSINATFTTGGVLGAGGVQSYVLTAGVPEPAEWAAMGMLASGLGGLVVRARRRRNA